MDQSVIVCQKHNKSQSNLSLILSNYYVCMNRYCPDAYKVLCSSCKTDHRDHAIKILNIQDLAFLIDRMLKMPFRQAGTFIVESVQVLKRLKLVYEFSNKITKILTELQHETLDLISMTQKIIAQYSQCKNSAIQLSEAIYDFESKQAFEAFKNTEIKKLQRLDFNPQKDKLQYGNLEIKQKQDVRKKNLSYVRRKIEEVKEYSMKIIEVILNADESDQQEEDLMKKKKLYDALKVEIQNMCQNNMQMTIKANDQPNDQLTQINKKVQTKSVSTETMKSANEDYEKKIKDLEKKLEVTISVQNRYENDCKKYLSQLEVITNSQKKTDMEFKNKITVLQKEKENLNREKQNLKKEKQKVQKAMQQKLEVFGHYEKRLRDNFTKRNSRYKERQDIIKQLGELVEYQRKQSRSKDSTSKENGEKSKIKN